LAGSLLGAVNDESRGMGDTMQQIAREGERGNVNFLPNEVKAVHSTQACFNWLIVNQVELQIELLLNMPPLKVDIGTRWKWRDTTPKRGSLKGWKQQKKEG
jgi:hypothetical protein